MSFTAITRPEDFRIVTRAHVLAWRKVLEDRALSGATIRRKLAALSSLFEYLCEKNAVDFNPVKGAKRPKVESNEGKTSALGDHQARMLLDAPDPTTLKGKRDRALLSVLLYHGLRREELCQLKVRDIHARRGVLHSYPRQRQQAALPVAARGQRRTHPRLSRGRRTWRSTQRCPLPAST
jgi:site-specific recombinase XerD